MIKLKPLTSVQPLGSDKLLGPIKNHVASILGSVRALELVFLWRLFCRLIAGKEARELEGCDHIIDTCCQ